MEKTNQTPETPKTSAPKIDSPYFTPEDHETTIYKPGEGAPTLPFGDQKPPAEPQKQEVEEPQEEQTPKEPEEDPFAPKFAALSKKEKEIRQERQRIEAREKELTDRSKKYEAMEAVWNGDYSKLNDLAQAMGKKPEDLYSDLTKYFINNQQVGPEFQIKSVEQKLEELEKKVEEGRKQKKDLEQKQNEQKIFGAINDTVQEGGYDLIQHFDCQQMVYDVLMKQYQDTGEVPDLNQTAQQVEKYLEQQVQTKYAKSKKLRELILANSGDSQQQTQEQPITPQETPKQPKQEITLQNTDAGGPSRMRRADGQLLDREEHLSQLLKEHPVWIDD